MRSYHAEIAGLELAPGMGTRLRFRLLVDGGGGGTAKPPTTTDKPPVAGAARAEADKKKLENLQSITKDGKVTDKEKTSFDPNTSSPQIKSEEDRLHAALKDKVAATRDAKPGESPYYTYNYANPSLKPQVDTDRTKKLKDLEKSDKLDDIQKQIDERKKDLDLFPPGTPGRDSIQKDLDSLQGKYDARKKDEDGIVQDVKDKKQLDATLELEKLKIQDELPANAKDDYQALREKAQPYLDLFNKNKGDWYHGSVFLGMGEDWGDEQHLDFDKMVKELADDPSRLKRWSDEQDSDVNRGAVAALTGIVNDYKSARDAQTGVDDRVKAIESEQKDLRDSVDRDMKALSAPTIDQLNKDLAAIGDGGAQPEASTPAPSTPAPDAHDHEDPPTSGGGPGASPTDPGTPPNPGTTPDGNGGGTPADPNSPVPGGQPAPPDGNGGPGGSTGTGGGTDPNSPVPSGQPTPPAPPKVSNDDTVAKHNGMAGSYRVQRGDNLSKIAERYSQEYHVDVSWNDIYNANKGQIDDPDLIYGGQVFVIPGVDEKIQAETDAANAAIQKQLDEAAAAQRERELMARRNHGPI